MSTDSPRAVNKGAYVCQLKRQTLLNLGAAVDLRASNACRCPTLAFSVTLLIERLTWKGAHQQGLSTTSPIPGPRDNVLRYAAAILSHRASCQQERLLRRLEEENRHYAVPERRMGKNEATGAIGGAIQQLHGGG